MEEKSCRYRCNLCNKNYSSSNSLWNHNKKYHNLLVSNSKQNVSIDIPKVSKESNNNVIYKCKFCNFEYKHKQSKWRHEKTCKNKDKLITVEKSEFDNIKKEISELRKKLDNN